MNHRLFHLIILLTLLASLAGTGSALAQGPLPPMPPGTPVPAPWDPMGRPAHPLPNLAPSTDLSAQALMLGPTGLSYRYVQTLGQTGVGYFDDTAHLNYPFGLGLDASGNVWIGELRGDRAMKYDSTGTFLQQIGVAGQGSLETPAGLPITTLWEIADVGVDSGGNVWVVDEGTAHVAKFNSAGVFQSELGVAWTHGTDNSHFDSPVSIAFDASGNIYVSDGEPWTSLPVGNAVGHVPATGNQRIQVFNSGGTWIKTIGVTGVSGSDNTHFNGPRHITINGNLLYIADTGNNRVQIFNISNPSSPTYVGTVAPTGANALNNPSGVAVDANYIYVADTENGLIKAFNKSAPYAYVAKVGDGSIGAYQLDHPYDVAVDASGHVYVSDFTNIRVQEYTFSASTFTFAATYGIKGVPYLTDDVTFNRPSGMVVASNGSVILTEDGGQRLIRLTPGGAPDWTVGTAGVRKDFQDSNAAFSGPADVALDPSGRVYVADRWHNRVQIFNGTGSYSATLDLIQPLPGGCPGGVYVAGSLLYVADTCDHTVRIYNSSTLNPVATMGVSAVPGSDNAHFRSPEDVVVDAAGTIYVSDQDNDRVQVFNSSRVYVRTIGVAGGCGADFAHLCLPDGLAVDSSKHLFITDAGNNRVQVFDSSGAYLTTIGGLWGSTNGDMRSPSGVAVDSAGNVYVADKYNHRIQKFAPAVPGWTQMNLNGFGDLKNGQVSALAAYNTQLYAGTTNSNGAQLWRSSNGTSWSSVMTNGFGNSKIVGFDDLTVFGGQLYAGLWGCGNDACTTSIGGQIWRSANGTSWSAVLTDGFRDTGNGEIYKLAVFNNRLFAATLNWSAGHGAEVWSSATGDAGTWSRVVANGFGDSNNWAIMSLKEFNGSLYAGTWNPTTGGQVFRCQACTGSDWAQVNLDGFGDIGDSSVTSLESMGTWLYASTAHDTTGGFEVWRCHTCDGSDWTKVADNGLANPLTAGDGGLVVFNSQLYFVVSNNTSGAEVWRCTTCDGSDWTQAASAGFGDANNTVHADKTEEFNGRLYIGTYNYASGGELWSPPAIPYPTVSSIVRVDPSPTIAATVHFTVTFTEAVTGVNAGDFKITKTSALVGSSISGVTGSGTTYAVTVARGTGNGTLRLDVVDDDTILDAATGLKPLGGVGAGNGNYTAGLPYIFPVTVSYKSVAASDGWIPETGENTNLGGVPNSTAASFNLGDDATNKQYRAILSFNTATLPDTAVITSATLKFRKLGQVGAANPFLTLGNILADMRKGDFGTSALQSTDFQTGASKNAALSFTSTLTAGWYTKALVSSNFALVNKLGDTQFRLRFTKDDNNNHIADYLQLYSGNAPAASQPVLTIQYYVP